MFDRTHYPAIVIGGGQAGLSASARLKTGAIDHLVLERDRVAEAWRSQRWDSFCLVTPNWQCTLPGYHYDAAYGGDDPDGFMARDEIIAYIEGFRAHIHAPVVEGVEVANVTAAGDGFRVTTSAGELTADQIIVATGGYHRPKIPAMARDLPDRVVQLHSSTYRNADQAPEGGVLVIGTGQSGCQIAEDLHLAGRDVHLAVGGAPRAPRFYRGRDVTAWLVDMGHYDVTVDEHPDGVGVRRKANHYMTGRGGGRDIDLRHFATEGMKLHGRLSRLEGETLHFRGDLAQNLDGADATAERIKASIDTYILVNGIDAPKETRYRPAWRPADPFLEPPDDMTLPIAGISTVIWCTGFDLDYSWIDLPALDAKGYPHHKRGVSPVAGLYFLGLPWMHTWGSGRFSAIGDDAAHVVSRLTEAATGRAPAPVV
ncbi:MAG: MSMEG_0569 family flavin-dependent oxidoreductase [Pseudomonadota bacterium]